MSYNTGTLIYVSRLVPKNSYLCGWGGGGETPNCVKSTLDKPKNLCQSAFGNYELLKMFRGRGIVIGHTIYDYLIYILT